MNKDFNNQILSKIKTSHIKPRPKWQFLLRNYVVWAFGVVLLILGALSFSVLIYLVRFNDWEVYNQISDSFLEFFILTLPYFWIVFLIFFVLVINYNIKHTKRGYKYSVTTIVVVSIFFSSLFGFVFYKVGIGQALDDVLGESAPFYERIINPRILLWEKPEKGRLAGMIKERLFDCEYELIDRQKEVWRINIKESTGHSACELQIGKPLKLIGMLDEDNIFFVSKIISHGPGRGVFGFKHRGCMLNFEECEKY